MAEWLPIESAPKGRVAILVYCESVGWQYFVVKWSMSAGAGFWRCLDGGGDYQPFWDTRAQPTHWQPLPEPPK